ncbi:3'-5' exonuclease [Promicromonospora sp. NFX87]|uniref:3'-5' exonuclease n=1 Tax=Promicromonospora sp. NFX87 TaxID=3402691 RepID=UPI003AFA3D6A
MTITRPGGQPVSTSATRVLDLPKSVERSGLTPVQWAQAIAMGLIPTDEESRPAPLTTVWPASAAWPSAVVDDVAKRRAEIVAVVGSEPPIGERHAAKRLAARTGVAVTVHDVMTLTEAGQLTVVAEDEGGWPLWGCSELDALPDDQIAAVTKDREEWFERSMTPREAARLLGWPRSELETIAAQRDLTCRWERYARSEIEALAHDPAALKALAANRLLIADAAAEHMRLRRSDFNHLVNAGLVVAHKHHTKRIGRQREQTIPLYRTGDLNKLLEHPAIDWAAAQNAKPGERSPLRHLAPPTEARATVVRRALADLSDRFGTEVWAWFNPYFGRWECDYERHDDTPTVTQFREAIAEHPALTKYADDITVSTRAGAAIRWARAMRAPGAAVILDTETTGLEGFAVEIAVVDAATGDVLLDTLVQPSCPIEDGARTVHKIEDSELATAPALAEVWPQLLEVTRGRIVLAYNAPFDRDVVERHAQRDGLELAHLGEPERWQCLMAARSDWLMTAWNLRLDGGHRALEDCIAARDLLTQMTEPAPMLASRN